MSYFNLFNNVGVNPYSTSGYSAFQSRAFGTTSLNSPFASLFSGKANTSNSILPLVFRQAATTQPASVSGDSSSNLLMMLMMLLSRKRAPIAPDSTLIQTNRPTAESSTSTGSAPIQVALLNRTTSNETWKADLNRTDPLFENAGIVNKWFGGNEPTSNAEGGDKMELFDQSGKKLLSVGSRDLLANSQYLDVKTNTWKDLSEKFKSLDQLQSVGDKWNWDNTDPNRLLEIRYTDPATKAVYDIGRRWFVHKSPIVLDTDGNGKIDLTSVKDGVQFDIDGDGKKDQVAWTQAKGDKTDAWLTLDRNGNGQIDSGKELFGNQHGQANGYEELKKFDDNQDGVIDAKDAVYAKLKTWKDINHDGISQASEMQDLKTAGVESVKIGYAESSEKDAFGNELRQQSDFTRTDEAAAKLARELGKSAASLKTGLSVDAWLQTLKSA